MWLLIHQGLHLVHVSKRGPRGPFQYKSAVLPAQDSHSKDKTVSWPYYLYDENTIHGKMVFILKQGPGPWFYIKMSSYQYRKSHCGDKTILRPSYLHNGISYTGKMTSLYWIRAQILQYHCEPIDFLVLTECLGRRQGAYEMMTDELTGTMSLLKLSTNTREK